MDQDTIDENQSLDSIDGEDTAAKVLQRIENAWLNEKFAPEILPHRSDDVECMLQQIFQMEENTKRLEKSDIRLAVHKMEIDRIRFVIASYLRTRLEKIEQYTIYILLEEENRTPEESYLTPDELKFAKEYLASIETLFKTVALQHMPTNVQRFDTKQLMVEPNLRSHVFMRVNETVDGGVMIHGITEEQVDLVAGTQLLIQYQPIAELVKTGVIQLI